VEAEGQKETLFVATKKPQPNIWSDLKREKTTLTKNGEMTADRAVLQQLLICHFFLSMAP
jgi:hypothetical protein